MGVLRLDNYILYTGKANKNQCLKNESFMAVLNTNSNQLYTWTACSGQNSAAQNIYSQMYKHLQESKNTHHQEDFCLFQNFFTSSWPDFVTIRTLFSGISHTMTPISCKQVIELCVQQVLLTVFKKLFKSHMFTITL